MNSLQKKELDHAKRSAVLFIILISLVLLGVLTVPKF